MLELIYTNNFLTFNGQDYTIIALDATSDIIVLVSIENDLYNFTIALQAKQVTINGVLQTSAQMIIDTLSNG